jgi:photosystem II stability/assembly factor-like uncharacterized protein
MRKKPLLLSLLLVALAAATVLTIAPGGAAPRVDAQELLAASGLDSHLAAREEHEEMQEPGDAMRARSRFGADSAPESLFPAAMRKRAAIEARTAAVAPGAAAAQWKLEGPSDIGGRVLDVAVDPERADTIYIAAASGGVWKSTDAGKTFEPAWPADYPQTIGALVITPSGRLIAGTGEAGPGGGSLTYGGYGVYASDDRGKTWKHLGLEKTSRIGRIAVDPSNERRIFVAAVGHLYKPGPDRGLYLTEDGGASWKKVLTPDNERTGAADVVIDPNDAKVVYASTWEVQRTPDQRVYQGLGSGLYKSTDGGLTFDRIGTPIFGPRADLSRIGIAVGNGETDRVYAIATGAAGTHAGLYVSDNGGTTFRPTGDQSQMAGLSGAFVYGWWFGRIWVDPASDDTVWVAGVSLLKSTNAGQTFANGGAGVHADQHAMAWDPKVANRVYLGNDGGVYRSDDGGTSWTFGEYQPFSQLYTVDVSEQDPSRKVAGLQDNGVNRSYGGEGDGDWNEIHGGDGERATINPENQDIVYACHQYGECEVFYDGGENGTTFTNEVVSTRKNWLTPIELEPGKANVAYTGGEIMSRSTDDGETWVPISPELSNGPGKETNPLFRNFGTLTTIAPAPGSETGTIYAGTDDGNLWYTHSGGGTSPTAWTKASDPDLPKAWITRVEVDRSNPKVAYVTYSGMRQGDDAAYILRTTDGGENWDNITGSLPAAPLNDVNIIGKRVFVAGDMGVFFTEDGGKNWLKAGGNLPLAPIFELRHHPATNTLYAGTFGRSIWKLDLADLDKAPPVSLPPVVTGPSGKALRLGFTGARCSTKGKAKLRVKAPKSVKLKTVRVLVNGRAVKTLKGKAIGRPFSLKKLKKNARVQIVGTTTDGKKITGTKKLAVCKKKQR